MGARFNCLPAGWWESWGGRKAGSRRKLWAFYHFCFSSCSSIAELCHSRSAYKTINPIEKKEKKVEERKKRQNKQNKYPSNYVALIYRSCFFIVFFFSCFSASTVVAKKKHKQKHLKAQSAERSNAFQLTVFRASRRMTTFFSSIGFVHATRTVDVVVVVQMCSLEIVAAPRETV